MNVIFDANVWVPHIVRLVNIQRLQHFMEDGASCNTLQRSQSEFQNEERRRVHTLAVIMNGGIFENSPLWSNSRQYDDVHYEENINGTHRVFCAEVMPFRLFVNHCVPARRTYEFTTV